MMKNLLIVGPAWVGDMVMAQTLFRLLHAQQPNVQIDVLAPDWTSALLSRMPEVRSTISFPFKHGELRLKDRYQFAKTLRERAYSEAIVLPNSFKSALIPWFAGIPKRTGWLGEARFWLLNDARRLDKARYPLMIERFMALGLPAGAPLPPLCDYYPQFHVTAADTAATAARLGVSFAEKPVLAMCPGAEFGPSKRWVPAYYAAVASQKIKEGWAVWLFGSAKDKAVTAEIMSLTENQCVDLSGRCQLPEAIDLFAGVKGVLTNDSGLLHVAAALNRPAIAVYGSTSPDFTPPLSPKATVLKLNLPCQPCFKRECPLQHHRCMRDITPPMVLDAMQAWES